MKRDAFYRVLNKKKNDFIIQMIELRERILFEENQNNPSWKSWSNFRFLNMSTWQFSTNTIFNLFIFSTFVFFISCNSPKNKNIESSVNTFDECIYPKGAFIYKNYLIILGENTVESSTSRGVRDSIKYSQTKKIIAIDLYTNKIDNSAFKDMNTDSLTWLFVRNDSLYGKFASNDSIGYQWKLWKNNTWENSHPFQSQIAFQSTLLGKNCKLIYEDSIYYFYRIDQGEWGGAIVFHNKRTGISNGFPMYDPPSQIFSDSSGYVVLGRSPFGDQYCVLRFHNPEQLPQIDDSLKAFFAYKLEGQIEYADFYNFFVEKMRQEIINSDSSNIEKTICNTENFHQQFMPLDSASIVSKFYHVKHMLIQTIKPYTHCYGIIQKNQAYYAVLNIDSMYYVSELSYLESDKLINHSILMLPVNRIFLFSRTYNNETIIITSKSDIEDACHLFTCLVITDNFIKTYHFTPED